MDPNGFHFNYMDWGSTDRQDIGREYTLTDYPKNLQKKVTLVKQFKSYNEGRKKPNPNAKVYRRQQRI